MCNICNRHHDLNAQASGTHAFVPAAFPFLSAVDVPSPDELAVTGEPPLSDNDGDATVPAVDMAPH
jgi:hypothetical protein